MCVDCLHVKYSKNITVIREVPFWEDIVKYILHSLNIGRSHEVNVNVYFRSKGISSLLCHVFPETEGGREGVFVFIRSFILYTH